MWASSPLGLERYDEWWDRWDSGRTRVALSAETLVGGLGMLGLGIATEEVKHTNNTGWLVGFTHISFLSIWIVQTKDPQWTPVGEVDSAAAVMLQGLAGPSQEGHRITVIFWMVQTSIGFPTMDPFFQPWIRIIPIFGRLSTNKFQKWIISILDYSGSFLSKEKDDGLSPALNSQRPPLGWGKAAVSALEMWPSCAWPMACWSLGTWFASVKNLEKHRIIDVFGWKYGKFMDEWSLSPSKRLFGRYTPFSDPPKWIDIYRDFSYSRDSVVKGNRW